MDLLENDNLSCRGNLIIDVNCKMNETCFYCFALYGIFENILYLKKILDKEKNEILNEFN